MKRPSGFGKKSPFVVLLGVLAAVAVILVPAGSATPGGSYTANLCDSSQIVGSVCPEGVSGAALSGGSTSLYLTLHKTSGSLRSASIGLPAGPATLFKYTGAQVVYGSGTPNQTATQVSLSDIDLGTGNLVTVRLDLTACTAGTYNWSGAGVIVAKDDASFTGTVLTRNAPSSLTATLDTANQCHLAVVSGQQPRDALKNVKITNSAFNPPPPGGTGGPIQVGLYTTPGNALLTIAGTVEASRNSGILATLGGDTTKDLASGIASFDDLTLNKANGSPGDPDYTLRFHLPGATDATSDGFSIVDAGKQCSGGNCQLQANFAAGGDISTTTSTVSTTFTTAGTLSLSFFTGGAIPAGCQNFTPSNSAGVTLRVDGTTGTAFITYGLSDKALKARYGPNYGQPKVPICVGALRVTAAGVKIPCESDSAGGWTGKALGSDGRLNGQFKTAICDPTTHLWWSVAPTYQDNQTPPGFAPLSIEITQWGGSGDGNNLRTFTITKPNPWDFGMRG